MRGAILATLLLLGGCASPHGAVAQSTHEPSALPLITASSSATSSSTPASSATTPSSPTSAARTIPPPATVTCSSPVSAGHELALVNLRGGQGAIVRDITDLSHPVSRCSIVGGASNFRFVNATHVSYISSPGGGGSSGALYTVDLTTQHTTLVRAWDDGWYTSWVYSWSPDGMMLSYLRSDSTGVEWHLVSAGEDRTLSRLGTGPPRDVSPDNDD